MGTKARDKGPLRRPAVFSPLPLCCARLVHSEPCARTTSHTKAGGRGLTAPRPLSALSSTTWGSELPPPQRLSPSRLPRRRPAAHRGQTRSPPRRKGAVARRRRGASPLFPTPAATVALPAGRHDQVPAGHRGGVAPSPLFFSPPSAGTAPPPPPLYKRARAGSPWGWRGARQHGAPPPHRYSPQTLIGRPPAGESWSKQRAPKGCWRVARSSR